MGRCAIVVVAPHWSSVFLANSDWVISCTMAWFFLLMLLSVALDKSSCKSIARLRLPSGSIKRLSLRQNETMTSFRSRYNIADQLFTEDGGLVDNTNFNNVVIHGAILSCKSTPYVDMSSITNRVMDAGSENIAHVDVQKKPKYNQLSANVQEFHRYSEHLKIEQKKTRKVALLYGNVYSNGSIAVEVIWEPLQFKSTDKYDIDSLITAARGSEATSIARMLGMKLVGWLFTHQPRDYFLSDRDIITAAGVQVIAEEGGIDCCVTISVTDPRLAYKQGDVVFEAYEISNSAYELVSSKAIIASRNDDADANSMMCVGDVVLSQKLCSELDTSLLTVPVPLVSHSGWLRSSFPMSTELKAADYRRHLAHILFSGDSEPSLDVLRDFHLLLYLFHRLPDFETLLVSIGNKDKNTIPSYFLLLLRQLCTR
jgi:hypothetical protein